MQVVSFSVAKYRSITSAQLALSEITILIGPNNEGKSNILRALAAALRILTEGETVRFRKTVRFRGPADAANLDWSTNYPVALQGSDPAGGSEFTVGFSLSPEEREQFRETVGSSLKGNLKLKLIVRREAISFEVVIKGPSKQKLSERREKIAEFIKGNVQFQYIPSVRTEAEAERVVETMLERELREVWENPEYVRLQAEIQRLQEPTLQRVGRAIQETVSKFVPTVRSVRAVPVPLRQQGILGVHLIVDDGTETDLAQKGDGVKSLVALSLMRSSSSSSIRKSNVILALEEPESHLHPAAVHELREVLQEIAASNQVIITTHSPVLAARANVRQNILVHGAHAKAARSLRDVREALGVRIADNLASANLVVLVEGETDRDVLLKWLPTMSPTIRESLHNGTLAIDWLGGVDKLAYRCAELKRSLCNVHCFLDNDEAARSATESAVADGRLDHREVTLATCPGMRESELEDLLRVDAYIGILNERYAIQLSEAALTATMTKWANRVANEFRRLGKPWNARVSAECKSLVASAVVEAGLVCVRPERMDSLNSLVASLNQRLAEGRPPKPAKGAVS